MDKNIIFMYGSYILLIFASIIFVFGLISDNKTTKIIFISTAIISLVLAYSYILYSPSQPQSNNNISLENKNT